MSTLTARSEVVTRLPDVPEVRNRRRSKSGLERRECFTRQHAFTFGFSRYLEGVVEPGPILRGDEPVSEHPTLLVAPQSQELVLLRENTTRAHRNSRVRNQHVISVENSWVVGMSPVVSIARSFGPALKRDATCIGWINSLRQLVEGSSLPLGYYSVAPMPRCCTCLSAYN